MHLDVEEEIFEVEVCFAHVSDTLVCTAEVERDSGVKSLGEMVSEVFAMRFEIRFEERVTSFEFGFEMFEGGGDECL